MAAVETADPIAQANLILEARRRVAENKVFLYQPYPWQKEFHHAKASERMLMAANQVGKTSSAAAEVVYHLIGRYPDWWQGHRFDHPVIVWTGSPTNETSRDIVQAELLGEMGENFGTGLIPKRYIVGKPKMRQAGVSDVIDSVKVRHSSGGLSSLVHKTYEQGWQKWQGKRVHVVWLDEEPSKGEHPTPEDYRILTESETRILSNDGILLVTFTPLHGVTPLVEHFQEGKPDTFLIGATWDDAPHLTEEKKASLRARYPAHETDARTKGIPMLGEGKVFRVKEEDIVCEPFEIPAHYARIAGCDFGIDHPAAGAWVAWDRDRDVIYVYDCYRKSDEMPLYHAAEFKNRGSWIPIAWPHDGHQRDKGSGKELQRLYRDAGANMLPKSARYAKKPGDKMEAGGGQPQEPIIMEVEERMRTGGFKVFRTCSKLLEEIRFYHRKNGKLSATKDDTLKATFYAVMMRRYAQPFAAPRTRSAPQQAYLS